MAGSYRSEVPGIGACTPQDSPPEEIQNLHELGYFTEMSYRSPQGELELRLDHGNEFRMGCEVWYRTRIFASRQRSLRTTPRAAEVPRGESSLIDDRIASLESSG